MALSVGNATPGRISGVNNASSGRVKNVSTAKPGRIASVGNSPQSAWNYNAGGSNGVIGTFSAPGQVLSSVTNQPSSQTGAYGNTMVSDPYAKYGGTKAYTSLVDSFNKQKSNLFGTALEAAQAGGNRLKGNILDLVDSLRAGQSSIDNQGINSELARLQGRSGVQDMVGQGIRSGATLLGSKNAGDSSAAGAIANAYGQIGNKELRNIGNQYEMGQRDIGLAQEDLDRQRAAGVRDIGESKSDIISNIVLDARGKLAALDADMAQADLPDRIAIEQEKNKIKSQVANELKKYDTMLKSKVSGVKGLGRDKQIAKAYDLQSAGYDLGDQAFDFSAETPAQFQGTGPFSSGLPIFTNRFTKER